MRILLPGVWLSMNMSQSLRISCGSICAGIVLVASGCFPTEGVPVPGPDKQAAGTIYGASLGAGAGAVTGAQLGSNLGPGAWIGAGLGGAYGMMSGLGVDLLEEDQLRREEEAARAEELLWVQHILAEHYERRLELHPNRDIYPADLFFRADEVTLTESSALLAREIARLTKRRMPWSRIVVAAYVTARDRDSDYASYLTQRRAEELAREFVRAGLEARRIAAQSVVLSEPILVDPYDRPDRYRQAIEIIALDY
ncbi:MAG: hypothetical protein KDD44_02485 [Bdellovibrionales bacterium]|nr:hypothetical protein [Bdellovibrionales bacterium]